jgi:hypothetical protein
MRTLLGVGLLALALAESSQNAGKVEAALPQSNATSAARLQFDAASLRLFNFAKFDPFRDPHPTPLCCRGVDGELFPNPGKSNLGPQPQGRCSGTFPPSELIKMAYASESGPFRTMGLPDQFDVGAQWGVSDSSDRAGPVYCNESRAASYAPGSIDESLRS